MELKQYKLSDVAIVEISSVDKKTKEGETPVRLCNFTDVYHNWAIMADMADNFMEATANAIEPEVNSHWDKVNKYFNPGQDGETKE